MFRSTVITHYLLMSLVCTLDYQYLDFICSYVISYLSHNPVRSCLLISCQLKEGLKGIENIEEDRTLYLSAMVCCTNFLMYLLKQTIHEATFVTGDKATRLSVHAVHEMSHGTFYSRLLIDRWSIFK